MQLFKKNKYINMCPSTRGRARGGGSREGVSPPGTSAVSKHETKSVTQHQGACSRGGVWGGVPPRARLLCPSTRPAAVSKHETCTVTKQTTGARARGGGPGGVSPPARLLCPSTRQVLVTGSPYLQHRVATLLVQHGRRHQNHPTGNPFLKSCRFRLCLVGAPIWNTVLQHFSYNMVDAIRTNPHETLF